jgi:hypothetical protein
MSKLCSLTSEVAAYLPLFYRLLLGDVDCGVELCCHVVTRPPVGRERWWTAGYAVGWPEVHGGVEEAVTGAAAGCPDERWCARSMRLCGRAVRASVLMSTFLMCVVGYSFLNELPFAGQMASFIQVTAGQPALPLAGWQSWWAWLPEGSSACQGPFSLFVEVDREGGSERVVCCGG